MRRGKVPPAFTNMGSIDDLDFDGSPQSAHLLVPPVYPPSVGVGLSGFGGTLSLTTVAYPQSRSEIEAFMEAIIDELPATEIEDED